jgi:hypothetical protein
MDVRRIADGVKLSLRFKTTEQVERAFIEDRKHQYMYRGRAADRRIRQGLPQPRAGRAAPPGIHDGRVVSRRRTL